MMNALIPRPSTPRVTPIPTPSPAPSPTPPPSPGTWRHPKFAEIVSRRNTSTFSEQDFKRAAFNVFALLLSFTFSSKIHASLRSVVQSLPNLPDRIHSTATYTTYALLALRLYLLLNFSLALLPLVPSRANDTISDIPLTPSQRALMGLRPSPSPSKRTPRGSAAAAAAARPPTPNSNNSPTAISSAYITPPRYKRTSYSPSPSPIGTTGINNNAALNPSTPPSTRSTSATYFSSSPLSAHGAAAPSPDSAFGSLSTSMNRSTNYSNSPFFSPTPRSSSGSPLLQKALTSNNTNRINDSNRNTDAAVRSSFSPSTTGSGGLRRSQSVREEVGIRSPGSGSGSGNGSRSSAVNYKWLYEKETRSLARGGAGSLS